MSDTRAFSPEARKIDPVGQTQSAPASWRTGDDRPETGPTRLARSEWAAAGLTTPDLPEMRRFRHARLVAGLRARDYGGVLLFDPLNIRYATDSTNMQIWNLHNPFRAVLVCADGHTVLWEYKGADSAFLSDFNPLVTEVRDGASFFYFAAGDRTASVADEFAGQVAEVMRAHAGMHRRLAVDKIMVHGHRALERAGFEVMEGEELTERARAIKGPEEIRAMRCALHACETAMAEMERACRPGLSEDEVWSVLHAENIKRGGEWIETRLLTSGPRTNPWFQECGHRVIGDGEIVAFDTDLVGPYGICADISRTWWVGDPPPRDDMRELHEIAREHVATNMELLGPGVSFRELTFGGHQLHPEFVDNQYSCRMHGVGLCDEWPLIAYPERWREGAFEDVLQPGMVVCVEALIGRAGGDFSIKLEDQVLITETGYENLTSYPLDARLSA